MKQTHRQHDVLHLKLWPFFMRAVKKEHAKNFQADLFQLKRKEKIILVKPFKYRNSIALNDLPWDGDICTLTDHMSHNQNILKSVKELRKIENITLCTTDEPMPLNTILTSHK